VLAETLAEKEMQAATMQSVAELTDQLQACRVLDEAYQLIARHCEVVGGSPSGAIYIMRSSRNRVERVAFWGAEEDLVQDCAPHECWALRKGARYRVASNLPNPPCGHAHDLGSYASTCLPIVAQGEMIGFIYVIDNDASAEASTPKIDFGKYLASVAEYGGQTIAALQMREELQRQLIRDPLTGLFNRRYMEETLDREKNRAARLGVSVSVISFDIDHFKRVNDTYGHDAGDMALKAVAEALKKGVRAEDIVCRTGGEEILVVLPSANTHDAAELADRLRRSVESIVIECGGIKLPTITISGGLASFPEDGQDWQAILKVADQRLYQAKRSGRNQIVGTRHEYADGLQ
jgi:diguanylate cyclase (GGDEF)-like protein